VSVKEIVARLIAVSGKDLEPDIQGEGTPHGEIDRQSSTPAHQGAARLGARVGLAAAWPLPGTGTPGQEVVRPDRSRASAFRRD